MTTAYPGTKALLTKLGFADNVPHSSYLEDDELNITVEVAPEVHVNVQVWLADMDAIMTSEQATLDDQGQVWLRAID